MKRPDPKLIAFWYKKLSESGFTDIERGKDMNQFPASTMPGDHVSIDCISIGAEQDEQEQNLDVELGSLTNADRAVFFRAAVHAAYRLKDHPDKPFILDWAETGNLAETCRDYGHTRKAGRIILAKFLDLAGLSFSHVRSDDDPRWTEPAPVRRLTRAEIKKLNYKNPKRIKDSSE